MFIVIRCILRVLSQKNCFPVQAAEVQIANYCKISSLGPSKAKLQKFQPQKCENALLDFVHETACDFKLVTLSGYGFRFTSIQHNFGIIWLLSHI